MQLLAIPWKQQGTEKGTEDDVQCLDRFGSKQCGSAFFDVIGDLSNERDGEGVGERERGVFGA